MSDWLSDSAIDRNDSPWQVWIGSFAIEHLEHELEQGGSILLFPNEPEPDLVISEYWLNHQPPRLWLSTDLLGEKEGEVDWFFYNDSRQNGVQSLGELQSRFPNLRLCDQALVCQQRFAGLMDRWIQEDSQLADLLAIEGGRLWFQGFYPASILSGVGTWLSRCAEVIWTPTASLSIAREHAAQELSPMLDAAGFAAMQELGPSSDTVQAAFSWRQDRSRRLAVQVTEQAQQLTTLATARDVLIQDVEQLQLHRDDLAAERDRLSGLTGELQFQLEHSSLLQETWSLRCLQLQEQEASLTDQRDDLGRERDGLLAERQLLLQERDGLLQQQQELVVVQTALQAERDGVMRERDAVVVERDGLLAERQSLLQERDGLQQQYEELTNQLELANEMLQRALRLRVQIAEEIDDILGFLLSDGNYDPSKQENMDPDNLSRQFLAQ